MPVSAIHRRDRDGLIAEVRERGWSLVRSIDLKLQELGKDRCVHRLPEVAELPEVFEAAEFGGHEAATPLSRIFPSLFVSPETSFLPSRLIASAEFDFEFTRTTTTSSLSGGGGGGGGGGGFAILRENRNRR